MKGARQKEKCTYFSKGLFSKTLLQWALSDEERDGALEIFAKIHPAYHYIDEDFLQLCAQALEKIDYQRETLIESILKIIAVQRPMQNLIV